MDNSALYSTLADLLVAFHTLYVGYVVVGQVLILLGLLLRWRWARNPWFRVSHLLCIAVVALEAMNGIMCPLTVWERGLRDLAEQSVNDSPIGWFFNSILFFNWPAQYFVWIHISFGAVVLATFLLAPPRFGRWRPRTLIPGLGLLRTEGRTAGVSRLVQHPTADGTRRQPAHAARAP
jgi:hypothetical protein